MNRIEIEILTALYLLYAYDCVYWISADEQAFTRVSTGWKTHQKTSMSFTLLNRKPVLADPFLLLPGFFRGRSARLGSPEITSQLPKIANCLNNLWLLEAQCRVQAMMMLIFLPWIVFTHRLLLLWQPFLCVVLMSHLLLLTSFFFALRQSAVLRPLALMGPHFLNPLGTIRLFDSLAQALFDRTSEVASPLKKTPG